MNIKDYTFTAEEECTAMLIYTKLKEAFPNTVFSYEDSIIGIGEPERHFMCYFIIRNNTACVKFKNRVYLSLNERFSILEDLNETIELFMRNDFKLKHCRSSNKTNSSRIFPTNEINDEFLCYHRARERLVSKSITTNFDPCSNRLKNALYNRSIYTTDDLFALEPIQIRNIPNLGRKSFNELCSFLLKVAADNNEETTNASVQTIQLRTTLAN